MPLSDVATGIWSFSASWTSSLCAPDAATPPPATMIGFFAFASSSAALRTRAISGSGRNGGTRAELGLDDRIEVVLGREPGPPCLLRKRR